MIPLNRAILAGALCAGLYLVPMTHAAQNTETLGAAPNEATMTVQKDGDARTYELATTATLRDNKPPDKRRTFSESPDHPSIRTGSVMFDGLYALAVTEAMENSVHQISDGAYAHDAPIALEAFRTGELWSYVWTRDLSYSVHLALASFDPARAASSLLFKTSALKPSVKGGASRQIIQDTGSGGSYPVSTDRAVWALGAHETLKYLPPAERQKFLAQVYPILCDTIEQDRRLIFDPQDGLYRGEQSFLDWREQTYPGWTKDNVLAIAMSKALSTNALHYFLLQSAAEYAGVLNQPDTQVRYTRWAADLKNAINRGFYDADTARYSAYLLADGGCETRVERYDLLGESLAVLFGIADPRDKSLLWRYPTSVFGPPVVYPQERAVPIYHNQAIWPFVTAYWIKAAKQIGDPISASLGLASLQRGAMLNLSNMENLDYLSGAARAEGGPRQGPVINSRRQLWSVAGYLSMVQDVVFGLETSWEGIRFIPFLSLTALEPFKNSKYLEWRNFVYQGTRNDVRVHPPDAPAINDNGACVVARVELNGKSIGTGFMPASALQRENRWEIFLDVPDGGWSDSISWQDVKNDHDAPKIFAPAPPTWLNGPPGGVSVENGHPVLRFRHDDAANVSFTIYRDGQPQAHGVRETTWTDLTAGDPTDIVHSYAVAAVDPRSSNVSHLTPARAFRSEDQQQVIPAKKMLNHGGSLVSEHHFENWGRPDHELLLDHVQVARRGRYQLRVEFANGAGALNTGIACAVKKLEVRRAGSEAPIASGYLVMPQSGDWSRYDLSSIVNADLNPGENYTLRISEDESSRNMSYLQNNVRYTGNSGGGDDCYNFVNVAAVHLLYVAALPQ